MESDESNHILYGGEKLESRQRIYWRVRVWDQNNQEGQWSTPAFFELGLLNEKDWTAKWIDPEKETDQPFDIRPLTLEKSFC